ncbi:MAG: outer membrane beta-barrel protein [Pseudomonadales bacterium]
MNTRRLLAFSTIGFFSISSQAGELSSSIITATSYDSNVYSTDSGSEVDDTIFQLGGELDLRSETEQRFDYQLSLRGLYDWYSQESDLDDMQFRERLRLGYDLSRTTRLTLDQSFRRVPNLNFDREDFIAGDTGIDVRKNRYYRSDMDLNLEHALSNRWKVDFSLEHQVVDFKENQTRSDSDTIGVRGLLSYTLSDRHDLGFGMRYASQDFDRAPSRLGAKSEYLGALVSWTFRISSNARLEFEGGPTHIDARQKTTTTTQASTFAGVDLGDRVLRANFAACTPGQGQTQPIASRCRFDDPVAPPIEADDLGAQQAYPLNVTGADLSNDDVVFFGRLALNVEVSDWEIEARMVRRPSAISGESLASRLDEIALSLDYGPASTRWRTYGEFRWEQRDDLTPAEEIDYTLLPGPNGQALLDASFLSATGGEKRDSYAILLGAGYAISRSFQASLEGRYRFIDRDDLSAGGQDSDTYVINLSLRYDLAPKRF